MDHHNNNNSIPVIDLKSADYSPILQACQDWGCFRIINFQHTLPQSLISQMKAVAADLLNLPSHVKQRNGDAIPGSGYMAPSPTNPHYEALGLYDAASPAAIHAFCSAMEANPNQSATMLQYSKAVQELMMEIVDKIGIGLGMDGLGLAFHHWVCQFRINKYSFTSETVGSQGVQLHTDSTFITILQDDEDIGGLEVMRRNGEFFVVDPCPGTLLVNFGDIATAWSNGRFLNVKHRVMCKEVGTRISIASFLLGPKETEIEAPQELVDAQHPRMFVPFKYNDFRKLRLSKKLHTGEGLDYLVNHSTK